MSERSSPASAAEADISRTPGWVIGCGAYLRSRWRGEVPLATVFWNDMLFVGTMVNVVTTLMAMFLLSLGAPTMLVVLTYFAPLPFNVFLVAAVWRSAEAAPATAGFWARCASLVWLLAATAL